MPPVLDGADSCSSVCGSGGGADGAEAPAGGSPLKDTGQRRLESFGRGERRHLMARERRAIEAEDGLGGRAPLRRRLRDVTRGVETSAWRQMDWTLG
jgi:hypothetical protein